MTYAQQKRHEKLRNKVVEAYDKFDSNTDPLRNERLYDEWIKAMKKCEEFEEKFF